LTNIRIVSPIISRLPRRIWASISPKLASGCSSYQSSIWSYIAPAFSIYAALRCSRDFVCLISLTSFSFSFAALQAPILSHPSLTDTFAVDSSPAVGGKPSKTSCYTWNRESVSLALGLLGTDIGYLKKMQEEHK
jgi:hypothetical protein